VKEFAKVKPDKGYFIVIQKIKTFTHVSQKVFKNTEPLERPLKSKRQKHSPIRLKKPISGEKSESINKLAGIVRHHKTHMNKNEENSNFSIYNWIDNYQL
jgi:hypothetical protein